MNKLENIRLNRGITQVELAKRTGIDRAEISKVENGVKDFKGNQWRAVAKTLNCTVDELLG